MTKETLEKLIREITKEEINNTNLLTDVKNLKNINKHNEKISKILTNASLVISTIIVIFGLDIFGFNFFIRGALERYIYPPEYILEQSTENISIKKIKNKSEMVKSEAPEFVWDSVNQWDEKQYSDFIQKPSVIETLQDKFERELVMTTNMFSQKDKLTPKDITSIGNLPIPATITMIGEDPQNTNCGFSVDNNKKQAIVVLPPDIDKSYFIAYGCDRKYPKSIYIRIVKEGTTIPSIDDVQIIGIEQGNIYRGQLEIRVTQKVASQMKLPGADTYRSKLDNAEVSINKAKSY